MKCDEKDEGVVMKIRVYILSLVLLSGSMHARWVSLFHKKITPQERMVAQRTNSYTFSQEQVPLFTQLLFSWNALRPSQGQLDFFVQARNAYNKRWGSWHRMIEWGKDVQRSYVTPSDGFTKYIHVRLETEKSQLSDAFRIKVVGKDGASVVALKAIAVTSVNMHHFKPETVESLAYLKSVYIPAVPKLSQFTLDHDQQNRICAPTSCTMLTRYLTGCNIDPIEFAARSYDAGLDAYGSWPFNMAHAFEKCSGKYWFFNTRLNSFIDLHRQLLRGVPVVVSVRGALPGASRPYANGHLLVVVGWDNLAKRVICHDPAMESDRATERRYRLIDFMKAWEQSRRLVYWASRVT